MIVGIRHAAVRNPDGVVYGRLPGFGLSDKGRAAASALAQALASSPVVAAYASPLDRAMETAALLAGPQGVPVQVDDRLLEWSFWVRWQGMQWSRIRERDPELLAAYAEDPGRVVLADTLEEAGERVLAWAREADDAHPDGLVIGVTHEAPLVAATLVGSGRPTSAYHSITVPHLGAVRLLPGPPEAVDLVEWAAAC